MVFFTQEFTLGPSPSRSIKSVGSTGHPFQWHSTAASAQDSELAADIVNWDTREQTHYYLHLILHVSFLREDLRFFQRMKHNLHYFPKERNREKTTSLRDWGRRTGTEARQAFDPLNLSSHRSERDSSQQGRQCSRQVVLLPQWHTNGARSLYVDTPAIEDTVPLKSCLPLQ